ncbi:MAG: hypothetical protein IKR85_05355 [Clostridia bacterium]|nr:hypothetical protein [Clostridia bacterium]
MTGDYFKRVHAQSPTRFWINNPTTAQAALAIEAGAINCTTNPTYTAKMLESADMRPALLQAIRRAKDEAHDAGEAAALTQRAAVGMLLPVFKPLHDACPQRQGFVSLQGDPTREDDPQNIINEALQNLEPGTNYIAKIPTTRAGLEAIRFLAGRNVPIIATEIMSIAQCLAACRAYKDAQGSGPFFVTCIAGIFDDCLKLQASRGEIEIDADILFQAGCALMRRQYRIMRQESLPGILLGGGARGLHHFTEFVGGACDITINWKGTAEELINKGSPVLNRMDARESELVLDELLSKSDVFRRAYLRDGLKVDEFENFPPVRLFRSQFEDGWAKLIKEIENT